MLNVMHTHWRKYWSKLLAIFPTQKAFSVPNTPNYINNHKPFVSSPLGGNIKRLRHSLHDSAASGVVKVGGIWGGRGKSRDSSSCWSCASQKRKLPFLKSFNFCFHLNFKKQHLVCFNMINCYQYVIKIPTVGRTIWNRQMYGMLVDKTMKNLSQYKQLTWSTRCSQRAF